ncbi:LuxR family transcriptional regulator [Streptomyces sp. DH37]|uniref:helix-turn-helix transcriptional regulator n=1 Tax=Streptomyces sp. DH37 TaxID=3040122 RepID=UPI0024433BC1|nr:helix-turn-helix transcriptional regulator [Streptomyces sp. DH37]MDG9701254.1 helix-turn-helix transcriptional regulator [Streptomyces sp. DH37]
MYERGDSAVRSRPQPCDDIPDLASGLVELARKVHDQAVVLASAMDTAGPAVLPAPVPHLTRLDTPQEIDDAIRGALGSVGQEVLTAQPGGPRPRHVLAGALESVRRQLCSGIAMRTLYQHSARFDEATKEYVRTVTGYGAEVRTLPEFFERVIIVDRSVAFVPGSSDRTRALRVTEPSLIGFLVDVFERAWDRAEDFPFVPTRSADAAPEVIPSLHESIKKLLVAGYSDRAIARRMGISERSLQTHVGRIKEQYGAENRLQLGFLLGRAEGWGLSEG